MDHASGAAYGGERALRMLNRFKQLTKLQLVVSKMEEDLGLSGLSNIEKKTLLAIVDLNANNGSATTSDILAHPMLNRFSRQSTFRALKALGVCGKVLKVGIKRGYYVPVTQ